MGNGGMGTLNGYGKMGNGQVRNGEMGNGQVGNGEMGYGEMGCHHFNNFGKDDLLEN